MARPLVSVLVPTYNHARFIGSCIESVLAQSYPDWEMIVVDDGSTDATLEVAGRYGDERIRVLAAPHRGIWRLHETYNTGLRAARGAFIGILEGDDLWLPRHLEAQVPLLDNGVVLAFGRLLLATEDGRTMRPAKGPPRGPAERTNRPPGAALRRLFADNYIHACTVLVDRQALERIGGFRQAPGFPAVDYTTWLPLALEGEFRFVDAPMGCWRLHPGQSTSRLVVEQAEGGGAYALEFYRSLDPAIRALSGWSEVGLHRMAERARGSAHAHAGRRRLVLGDRRAARHHFLTALRWGDSLTRGKAIAGLFCSVLGIDPERLVSVLGRTPLGSRAGPRDHVL